MPTAIILFVVSLALLAVEIMTMLGK